jgi:hypothetical protein
MLSQNSTRPTRKLGPGREEAESIAVAALGHMAQDTEIMGRFMAHTGLEPGNLRSAAASPDFLAAVLEFVCANEPLLLAVASGGGLAPERIDSARRVLSGPEPEGSA